LLVLLEKGLCFYFAWVYNESMSRAERIKEEIGWLKLVFGGFIAVDVSLVAWLAQNYKVADTYLLVLAVAAIIAVTVVLVAVNRSAFKRMARLEDL
jgi:hypothetical protein